MMMLLLLFLLIVFSSNPCQATCALTLSDWTQIQSAYLDRNHYEALRSPACDENLSTSLKSRYGECTLPLATILANSLPSASITNATACTQYFTSTLYNGKGSNSTALANTLCNKPFHEVIDSHICNALTVVGCPTTRDQFKFAVFASCYGAYLKDKTREEQRAYYDSGGDVQCMVDKHVCVDFVTNNWNTCPLNITDVFEFIDSSKATYTCETIFPGAPERCRDIFMDSFLRYCPLPTELEKNLPFILVFGILGPCVLAALAYALWRHTRQTKTHHISVREVMTNVVNNLEVFNHPMHHAHPELEAVLATSKFKGVSFDKKTQMWSVLGEFKQYATEKEAAQRAYLIMARLQQQPLHSTPGHTRNSEYSTSSIREFTSMEIMSPKHLHDFTEEYIVMAKPLTQEQTKALRFDQLVTFYEFWEPEKPDIPDHARNLLEKYDFDAIVRAIKTKYGVCPPAWDSFADV